MIRHDTDRLPCSIRFCKTSLESIESFRYSYEELTARDKTSLDVFWLTSNHRFQDHRSQDRRA